MDITWATILKVLIAGIGTYVVFPAALILRDYLLWKFINAYILNETLMKHIREYATIITIWNNNFAVNTFVDGISSTDRVFYETAMMLEIGNISEVFKGERGAYIVYLISKDLFNEKDYQDKFEEYKVKEEKMYRRQIITEWLNGVVEDAEVIDYRDLYSR